jgi:hypothetical protein
MPHAELKYSADLEIDAQAIFKTIEDTINEHDAGSGQCKCRAYPSAEFHHTHILISISMLPKPHRDDAFTEALINDLETKIKSRLEQNFFFSLLLEYSLKTYVTNEHRVDDAKLKEI